MTTHWLLKSTRRTGCGRPAKATAKDSRDPKRVTCRVCLRAIAAKRRACAELRDR
jgi:hypothetical protein